MDVDMRSNKRFNKLDENHNLKKLLMAIGCIFLLFFISGLSFKTGLMLATFEELVKTDSVKVFYSSSWSVYTTIFGLLGIVLGVVFPLYQNNELRELNAKTKKELQELNTFIEKHKGSIELLKVKHDAQSKSMNDDIARETSKEP